LDVLLLFLLIEDESAVLLEELLVLLAAGAGAVSGVVSNRRCLTEQSLMKEGEASRLQQDSAPAKDSVLTCDAELLTLTSSVGAVFFVVLTIESLTARRLTF
jgi:hypothetical protein